MFGIFTFLSVYYACLTPCRPDGLLIKYPPVPGHFKRFECSTQ